MNNYELILILNPDLSNKFDEFQTKFEKTLTDLKFQIDKLENIGRRQLAYSILNHNKGHYAIFQIQGPSDAALELETKLKYDTSVIRHLLLKVENPSLEDSMLLVESRETKKTPQDETSQDKPKTKLVEKNESSADQSDIKAEAKEGE
ncbi:ribosomal protein S6 [SAR86 cluster bacterium SAR86E]|uniref:Small ribosomal subunit protein bS6 n=1 Tax=SAR86 cluster bacterium SAR86E TaxID=1208365 RepID=K6FCL1_9GAMM|nr:ribosomal protein S6 [SAR86 cluster bacterium SAR86E]